MKYGLLQRVVIAFVLVVPLWATAGSAHAQSASAAARSRDASIDRGLVVSHAETLPEGQATFNDYELFLVGMSYGVTDRLQLGFTPMPPLFKDIPLVGITQGKYAFLRGDNMVVSGQVNLNVIKDFDSDGTGGSFGGGVATDVYLDAAGREVLHASVNGQWTWGGAGGDPNVIDGFVMTASAGYSGLAGEHVKFIAEAVVLGVVNDDGLEMADAMLFNYGVRFFSDTLAADLAFMKPLLDDSGNSPFLMGLPLVTFSYRF